MSVEHAVRNKGRQLPLKDLSVPVGEYEIDAAVSHDALLASLM